MNAPDTASDGPPARSIFLTMEMPPRRRRTMGERLRRLVRSYAATGVFAAMLVACCVLLVLSR